MNDTPLTFPIGHRHRLTLVLDRVDPDTTPSITTTWWPCEPSALTARQQRQVDEARASFVLAMLPVGCRHGACLVPVGGQSDA